MTLWDDVKSNLTEWYGVAADKTGDLAKVGVRRYDIFGLSRDIERQFSEIGSLVYNALGEGRSDILEDPVLMSLVDKVRDLEQDLQGKEQEISEIKTQAEERQSARAAAAPEPGPEAPVEESPAAEDVAEAAEDVQDKSTE